MSENREMLIYEERKDGGGDKDHHCHCRRCTGGRQSDRWRRKSEVVGVVGGLLC